MQIDTTEHPTLPTQPRPTAPRALRAAIWAPVAGSLLALSAPWWWLGEIAANLGWQLGWATVVCATIAAIGRRLLSAGALLLLAAAWLWPEASLWLPGDPPPPGPGPTLTLASCNVLRENTDYAAFRAWVERTRPDVLVCLELDEAWRATLEALDDYPHRLYSPDVPIWTEDIWGTALLSRTPFLASRRIPIAGDGQRPILEARVALGAGSVLVRGVHPQRVGLPWRVRMRSITYDRLTGLAWGPDAVLAGDLNATSTSPVFRALLSATGLRDSRQGFGRQPSYTTTRWIPGLRVAIDHVLVGSGLAVLDRRTDAVRGSDHRFVVVRLAARPAAH